MSIIIDLIGSALIAGYIMLLGLRINMNMSATTTTASTNVNVQEAMVNAVIILESDFKKIGYGVADPTTALVIADSNRIRYRADMNRNGTVDSVEWYVGNSILKITGAGAKKDSLRVRTLYRKYNNQAATIAATNVTAFKLRYLDQDGGQTSVTAQVSMIEMTIAISSHFKVADQVNTDNYGYATTLVRHSRLSTRNTKRHG